MGLSTGHGVDVNFGVGEYLGDHWVSSFCIPYSGLAI